jgi:hypothetical protein
MSADPSGTPSNSPPPPSPADFVLWLAVGAAGVALLFAGSVHVPQEVKLVGLYGIGLGLLAGWGLGQWALARNLRRPTLVAAFAWGMIAAGEVLAAVQSHRLGVKPERSESMPDQIQRDMVTEGMRQYYAHEPEDASAEDLVKWREGREFFERGERQLQEHREARRRQRSFYGYLANRIPEKKWGKWDHPWPAVFWVAEVLLASTAGAWLARRTVRAACCGSAGGAGHPNPDHAVQGTRP